MPKGGYLYLLLILVFHSTPFKLKFYEKKWLGVCKGLWVCKGFGGLQSPMGMQRLGGYKVCGYANDSEGKHLLSQEGSNERGKFRGGLRCISDEKDRMIPFQVMETER